MLLQLSASSAWRGVDGVEIPLQLRLRVGVLSDVTGRVGGAPCFTWRTAECQQQASPPHNAQRNTAHVGGRRLERGQGTGVVAQPSLFYSESQDAAVIQINETSRCASGLGADPTLPMTDRTQN